MKRTILLIVALSLPACIGGKSATVEAAEAVVAAAEAGHAVDPELLEQARAVLAAQPDPWWLDLLYGAASVYGLQAVLPRRGRQLVSQALRSGARLDVAGTARALGPLLLGAHSGKALGQEPPAAA